MSRFETHFENETVNGRWRVGHELGSGAEGVVHSVTDRSGAHDSAVIKFACPLDDHPSTISATRNALKHEKQMLRYLNNRAPHLKVPKVLDCGSHNDYPFFVMSKLGVSVARLWHDCNYHMTTSTILKITYEVLNNIEHLHGNGVTHGDIKTGNVLCDPLGQAQNSIYLVDFSLSNPLTPQAQMRDVADALSLMVKLLSNGRRSLLHEMNILPSEWTEPTVGMREEAFRNLDQACVIRKRDGTQVRNETRALLHEFFGSHPPNYSQMKALLRAALRRVD